MTMTFAILGVWGFLIVWLLRVIRRGALHREVGDVVARRRFRP